MARPDDRTPTERRRGRRILLGSYLTWFAVLFVACAMRDGWALALIPAAALSFLPTMLTLGVVWRATLWYVEPDVRLYRDFAPWWLLGRAAGAAATAVLGRGTGPRFRRMLVVMALHTTCLVGLPALAASALDASVAGDPDPGTGAELLWMGLAIGGGYAMRSLGSLWAARALGLQPRRG